MLKVNAYFNETVKSIGFTNAEGTATVGVMEPGDYEFGTATVEEMTVISGALTVLLPSETQWRTYGKGETFMVAKDSKFRLQVKEQTAYTLSILEKRNASFDKLRMTLRSTERHIEPVEM